MISRSSVKGPLVTGAPKKWNIIGLVWIVGSLSYTFIGTNIYSNAFVYSIIECSL